MIDAKFTMIVSGAKASVETFLKAIKYDEEAPYLLNGATEVETTKMLELNSGRVVIVIGGYIYDNIHLNMRREGLEFTKKRWKLSEKVTDLETITKDLNLHLIAFSKYWELFEYYIYENGKCLVDEYRKLTDEDNEAPRWQLIDNLFWL